MENKSSSSSSSSSRKRMCVRTHFQEEIIIEILSRLPVKSLVRFKCVSKSWNKLISEPYFKRKHLDHANHGNSRRLLITPVRYEKHSFSSSISSLTSDQTIEHAQKLVCPANIQPWGSEVCCYCDGLFCIKPWKETAESVEEPSIWNPSTRESKLLPFSELPPKKNADYTYGLGYDPACDDYKVIKVPKYSDSEIEILAMKSDSWRIIGKLPYKNFMSRLSRLAFVNGGFHWLARHHRGISEKHSLRSVVLISVNISNGMYGEVPLPKPFSSVISKVATRSGLVVLRGMLCLYYNDWFEKTFNLWEMKEYGVEISWTKMFSIPYIQLTDMVPRYMFEDGELLVYGLKSNGSALRTSEGASGLCNRKWRLVLEGDISKETFYDGYVYVESLISPKGF